MFLYKFVLLLSISSVALTSRLALERDFSKRISQFMNPSVDPCNDFYNFACGGFQQSFDVFDDIRRISVNDLVQRGNEQFLADLLSGRSLNRRSVSQGLSKLQNAFNLCQKDVNLNSFDRDLGNFLRFLDNGDFNNIDFRTKVFSEMVNLGIPSLIEFDVNSAFDQSDRFNLRLRRGNSIFGDNFDDNNDHFRSFQKSLLQLSRQLPSVRFNSQDIDSIFRFERDLFRFNRPEFRNKDFLSRNSRRGNVQDLGQLLSGFVNWNTLFSNIGLNGRADTFVIELQDYFSFLERQFQSYGWNSIRNVLKFHALSFASDFSPDNARNLFSDLRFRLGGRRGRSRNSHCVNLISRQFPLLTVHELARNRFGNDLQSNALNLVKSLQGSFRDLLQNVDWLDQTIRQRSLEKLDALGQSKVGFADFWLDGNRVSNFYRDVNFGNNFFQSELDFLRWQTKNRFSRIGNRISNNDFDQFLNDIFSVQSFYVSVNTHFTFTCQS
jgi:endothelin-converting enzyme/putative endopeptidase